MTGPAGVLLAGGASRRFGRAKVIEPVEGAPLFQIALRALLDVCAEVAIVIAPDSGDLPLPLGADRVRLVRDPIAFQGPLAGTLTGLRAVAGDYAVLAAADMPGLRPELVRLMVDRAAADAAAIVLADTEGMRPLPAVLPIIPARRVGDELIAKGERRLRALIERLDAHAIPMSTWAAVDPAGAWRRDVDVPEDLPKRAS